MSHYLLHEDFYNNVVRLPKDLISDPMQYLKEFFLDYNLVDLRISLDEILEACLTTDNPPFDSPERRADLILLHKNLELLFEAAFLLSKMAEAGAK